MIMITTTRIAVTIPDTNQIILFIRSSLDGGGSGSMRGSFTSNRR
jgi:hypothetical protein